MFYELSTASSPDDVQRCMYSFIRLARVRFLQSAVAVVPQVMSQSQQKRSGQSSKRNSQSGQSSTNTNTAVEPSAQQANVSSTANDSTKQSAKAFLLNKMFGGMMKQAKQASAGALSAIGSPAGFQTTSRRSGDMSSGLMTVPPMAQPQSQTLSD